MIGTTPMGMMKKGFGSSDRIVKNNILKSVHRKFSLTRKSKILKLKINKKLRNKAKSLYRKGEKSNLSWDPLLWTMVACLFIIAFFYNYWWAIMLVLICVLVIWKILKEVHDLIINKRKPVNKKLRNAKIVQVKPALAGCRTSE